MLILLACSYNTSIIIAIGMVASCSNGGLATFKNSTLLFSPAEGIPIFCLPQIVAS